ncbi:hypothetical protein ACFWGC_13015 [Cytobacillus pseudoceanisediminis]|uniref:hypothetical protein n=1 Tax=Cytobacillus pseudoceanisediminis TaxID=3051614 RepID=UPI00365D57CB
MLTKRDKAIITDLNRFRVMDRNSIAELHFANIKNPITAANTVLLRLIREGHIQRTTATIPYCYYGNELTIKKNSAKIGHWLAILEVYKEMRKHRPVETFQVEPKYGGKGTVEPDIFTVFRKTPFFIEVQKTLYSDKQMAEKINRYVDLCRSNVLPKPFPHVLIVSEQRYAIDGVWPFKVFQAQTFSQFIQMLKPQQKAQPSKPVEGGIRIVVQ